MNCLDFPFSLTGNRIFLRVATSRDASILYEGVINSLEHLRKFPATLPWSLVEPSLDGYKEFCSKSEKDYNLGVNVNYMIREKDSEKFVGMIGLHNIRPLVPKFEVGFWGDKDSLGRGYISEALCLVIDMAFKKKVNRIWAVVDSENGRAISVCERNGMVKEGVLRNDRIDPVTSKLRHVAYYAVTLKKE